MSNRFAAHLSRLNAAVDGEMGDLWDIRPMISAPNAPGTADPDRAMIASLLCYFTERGDNVRAHGEGLYRMARTTHGFDTQTPRLEIDLSRLPTGATVKHLDQVFRRDTGDVYEISSIQPNGEGRLVCELKHLGTEAIA